MYRFDLDKAVAAWRHSLRRDSELQGDDLDELESHLREHVAQLTREGTPQIDAFDRALNRLGSHADIEAEYRKVRFSRSRRRGSMLRNVTRSTTMLRTYATVAIRGLRRHPGTTRIGPLAFFSVDANPRYRVMSVRLASGGVRRAVDRVRLVWEEMLPRVPFEFTFVDDQVARAYRSETKVQALVRVAAGLAVLLACLGMLGLASISSIQRTKETGIRKVMGATVTQIAVLLSTDFLKPVALAVLVGCPFGYLLTKAWLQDYAYRIELSPLGFVSAAATSLAVAFLAVSYHVTKTALVNPTESLRYE